MELEVLNNTVVEAPSGSTARRDVLYIVIPITIIYLAIFLTGIIGNISTCFVIARNKYMHTATNYYLFSLAISDLLLLLSGLPPEMVFIWYRYPYIFGETFCIIQGFAAETSANATVLTITAFTVERYVAICHPFQSHTLSKPSRAIKFVILIWLLALGLACPQAIQYGVVPDVDSAGNDASVCTVKRVLIKNAFVISTLLFFVVPMTIITLFYIRIGLKLRRSGLLTGKRSSVNSANERGEVAKPKTSQNHVIKMLVAVVVAFFICWAPFHAQRLVAMHGHMNPSSTLYTIYRFLTYISGILYFLSTTVNPVLYHIMSHKFREAFKATFSQLCRRGKKVSKTANYNILLKKTNNGALPQQNGKATNIAQNSKVTINENHQPRTLTLPMVQKPERLERQLSLPAKTPEPTALLLIKEPRILKFTDLRTGQEAKITRSRGSSDSSQVTILTTLGKSDNDNNNLRSHSEILQENGKLPISEPRSESRIKRKCQCLNCVHKNGLIKHKCLFKTKSQAVTFENLAKRIRLFPIAFSSKHSDFDDHVVKCKASNKLSANTISNSSLQDMDESEYTSSELAEMMGQLNESQSSR